MTFVRNGERDRQIDIDEITNAQSIPTKTMFLRE